MTESTIINRVAGSGLITIDLESFYAQGERKVIDIKDQLFRGLILKEKDFRDYIANEDWDQYKDALVAVYCSTDAVIPTWAFMLVASKLQGVAKKVVFGDLQILENFLYLEALSAVNPSDYQNARVVIKGCGNLPVPAGAYMEITRILSPVVKSLMFGEPCSTVPVIKNK
jgi:hypothetical protein